MSTLNNTKINYFPLKKKTIIINKLKIKDNDELSKEKNKMKLIKNSLIFNDSKFISRIGPKANFFPLRKSNNKKFPLISQINSSYGTNYIKTECNSETNNTIFHNEKINEELIETDKNKNILLTSLFALPGTQKMRAKSLLKNNTTKKSFQNRVKVNTTLTPKIKNNTLKRIIIDINKGQKPILNIPMMNEKINSAMSLSLREDNNKNRINQRPKNNKNGIKDVNSFFKNRYFEDVSNDMNKKLRNKVFCHDPSVKDKLIEINQVGKFWHCVLEYWMPFYTIQKLKFTKKKFEEEKKKIKKVLKLVEVTNEEDDIHNNNGNQQISSEPRLYTYKYLMNLAHKNGNKKESKSMSGC